MKVNEIDEMVMQLLEEPVADENNNIVFSEKTIELIHKIAEKCNDIQIVKETKAEAERYAKDLSAEDVYMDMLLKISEAPTKIHMIMSARMLIPIIDRKIAEEKESNVN